MHFALVHELEQRGHVVRRCCLQYDDALAICGRVLEQIGELFRAGGKYEFVCSKDDACEEEKEKKE